MADYIVTTHNHRTGETVFDPFDDLQEAKRHVVRLATETANCGPGRTLSLAPVAYVTSDRRDLAVLQGGRALISYRVNNNVRHCRTCTCNTLAFG